MPPASAPASRTNCESVGSASTRLNTGQAMNRTRWTELLAAVGSEGDLAGIVNCWPLDMRSDDVEKNQQLGAFTVLRLVKALAEHDTLKPRLYLVTANAQPAPGPPLRAVDQAAIWGLGRVIGHQEFAEYWGGLIDIDDADDRTETAVRICRHILGGTAEDQLAIRGTRPSSRACARAPT